MREQTLENGWRTGLRPEFLAALEHAAAVSGSKDDGPDLDQEEILLLLQPTTADEQAELFRAADLVRARQVGDEVHLRGIIEFSNYCRCDCAYCGLRRSNAKLKRYRLDYGEIWQIAGRAAALGYRTLVLQSGEDPWYTGPDLARLIGRIKRELEVAVTLSLGERSREDYECWREAGADRYLLKHETADPELFARLRPGCFLEERLQCLFWLRELSYQIGSGNMVGLPGQSVATLVRDLLLLRELDAEMVGIGPFIPHCDTPLAGNSGGSVTATLRMVAVARLLLPTTHLPATTALGSIDPEGRQKALTCGANVIMPNVTPVAYRPDYQIYPNKLCLGEEPEHCRGCVEGLIRALGRTVAQDRGDSRKRKSEVRSPRSGLEGSRRSF